MLADSSVGMLPSREGVELVPGTFNCAVDSLASTAGDKGILEGGGGAVGDASFFSFSIVGQAAGEGMISDGKLSRAEGGTFCIACLKELESFKGTSSESSSETSYNSSKSVVQELVLLLHAEKRDVVEGAVDDAVGAGDIPRLRGGDSPGGNPILSAWKS